MKYLNLFENFKAVFNKERIELYLAKVLMSEDYKDLSVELFDFISEEGWLVSLEEEFGEELAIDDFEYLELEINEKDKKGLISLDDDTLNFFNEFDLKLKDGQEYPFDTLDFIDYDKGIVNIIRLI